MVEQQYPHTIVVTWITDPIQDPDTGIFTPGEQVSHTFSCRSEANSKADKVSGADGSMLDFAFNLYMPLTDVQIPFGADYSLTDYTGTFTGKVKRQRIGRFNTRLWL